MSTIRVDKITDNPDGSADMQLTCDDETISIIMEQGMHEVYNEISANVPTPDLIETYPVECKTLTLTDEQAQLLFQIGTVSAIRSGLDINNEMSVTEMFNDS